LKCNDFGHSRRPDYEAASRIRRTCRAFFKPTINAYRHLH
jgi:hypothetical protein